MEDSHVSSSLTVLQPYHPQVQQNFCYNCGVCTSLALPQGMSYRQQDFESLLEELNDLTEQSCEPTQEVVESSCQRESAAQTDFVRRSDRLRQPRAALIEV